jgi:hypothetical protein
MCSSLLINKTYPIQRWRPYQDYKIRAARLHRFHVASAPANDIFSWVADELNGGRESLRPSSKENLDS